MALEVAAFISECLRFERLYLPLNVDFPLYKCLIVVSYLSRAKLAEPLLCVKDTGKSQKVLLIILNVFPHISDANRSSGLGIGYLSSFGALLNVSL